MTTKEFIKIEQALLPDFPELAIHGRLLYWPTAESLLLGIHFDSSGFSKTAFYVQTFVMPLFVPSEHLTLGYGDRLQTPSKPHGWDALRPTLLSELRNAIAETSMPFLRAMRSLDNFISYLERKPENLRTLEALGCALARRGSMNEADKTLRKLEQYIDPSIQWQADVLSQTTSLRHQILNKPDAAIEQLILTEARTRRSLNLPAILTERHTCATHS